MRQRKKIAIVMHGARAGQDPLRDMVAWVREQGHEVSPHVTWEQGDAERLTRDSVAAGADVVIAAGGDGTVHQVVNGLAGCEVPLGILPLGTANDFARQVGIPEEVDQAMDLILHGSPTIIDTATVNGRRFLNVSSGGIGAEATTETSEEAKDALGFLAYAITAVRKLADPTPWRGSFMTSRGNFECDFVAFSVGNARASGGGAFMTPRASVVDGLLDLCVIENMPRAELARLAVHIRKGEHLDDAGVHYVKAESVLVRASRPVPTTLDGEPFEAEELDYSVGAGDLSIYLRHLPGEETGE
jgi:diacylglycerol kinase (ATP)